jgi:hypothetical protein
LAPSKGVKNVKALYTVLACLILSVAIFAQTETPTPPAVEDVYLAKDDGEGRAGEPAAEFRVTDVPIYCVVVLDTNGKASVKMNFVAVSVSGVKPETKVVSSSYTTSENQNRVNFTGRPDGKWTPGKYRVDVFLDGKIAKNVEFEIKGTGISGVTSASKFQPPVEPPKPKPVKKPLRPQP